MRPLPHKTPPRLPTAAGESPFSSRPGLGDQSPTDLSSSTPLLVQSCSLLALCPTIPSPPLAPLPSPPWTSLPPSLAPPPAQIGWWAKGCRSPLHAPSQCSCIVTAQLLASLLTQVLALPCFIFLGGTYGSTKVICLLVDPLTSLLPSQPP